MAGEADQLNTWSHAAWLVQHSFAALERGDVGAADNTPAVDGGGKPDGMSQIAEGAWVQCLIRRIPKAQQYALRAAYQGSNTLSGLKPRKARMRQDSDGVWRRHIERVENEGWSERRLSELSRWEQGQLDERRMACMRVGSEIDIRQRIPAKAIGLLALEWSGLYTDYATKQIRDAAGVSEDTVSRARRSVYAEMDRLRRDGINSVAALL